jgi:hypothetical protein
MAEQSDRARTITHMFLWALNVKNKNIFQGIDYEEKLKRRAKGKRQRAARKHNRA